MVLGLTATEFPPPPAPNPPIDPLRIIELVQKNRFVKLAGNDKLRIEVGAKTVRERVQLVRGDAADGRVAEPFQRGRRP